MEELNYRGNIDLYNRPSVRNSDGSISTVRSMGINVDGKEILIPTVSDDGRIMSKEEAINQYRATGKHLGIFDSVDESNDFAKMLHNQQSEVYGMSDENKTENPWEGYTYASPVNREATMDKSLPFKERIMNYMLPKNR